MIFLASRWLCNSYIRIDTSFWSFIRYFSILKQMIGREEGRDIIIVIQKDSSRV